MTVADLNGVLVGGEFESWARGEEEAVERPAGVEEAAEEDIAGDAGGGVEVCDHAGDCTGGEGLSANMTLLEPWWGWFWRIADGGVGTTLPTCQNGVVVGGEAGHFGREGTTIFEGGDKVGGEKNVARCGAAGRLVGALRFAGRWESGQWRGHRHSRRQGDVRITSRGSWSCCGAILERTFSRSREISTGWSG